jgi:hypothetical protein
VVARGAIVQIGWFLQALDQISSKGLTNAARGLIFYHANAQGSWQRADFRKDHKKSLKSGQLFPFNKNNNKIKWL